MELNKILLVYAVTFARNVPQWERNRVSVTMRHSEIVRHIQVVLPMDID